MHCRMTLLLLGLLQVLAVSAQADEGSSTPPETRPIVVVFPAEDEPLLDTLGGRLREFVGEGVEIEFVAAEVLSEHWQEEFLRVEGATASRCEGKPVDADKYAKVAGDALGHVFKNRVGEARRAVDSLDNARICLEEEAAPRLLQRVALVGAWVAFQSGESEEFDRRLRQAATLLPSLPPEAVESFPAEMQEAFAAFAAENEHLPTRELRIQAVGAPVGVVVDGRPEEFQLGTGGQDSLLTDLLPGQRLLQIVRPGPRTENVLLAVEPEGGRIRVSVASRVAESDLQQMFHRAMGERFPSEQLAGVLSSHPRTRPFERVLLLDLDPVADSTELKLLPLDQVAPGVYEYDEDFRRALTRAIERSAGDVRIAASDGGRQAPLLPRQPWRIRLGISLGPTFVTGYVYGTAGLAIDLETPWWLGLQVRPMLAFTRIKGVDPTVIHTFVLGGGDLLAAFTPRYRALRFVLAAGAALRLPDYRYDDVTTHDATEFRLHPAGAAGLGVSLGRNWVVEAQVSVLLDQVHDTTLLVSIVRELPLGSKGR